MPAEQKINNDVEEVIKVLQRTALNTSVKGKAAWLLNAMEMAEEAIRVQ
ncbi:hypothetical protein [Nitrospira sp. Nam74]